MQSNPIKHEERAQKKYVCFIWMFIRFYDVNAVEWQKQYCSWSEATA